MATVVPLIFLKGVFQDHGEDHHGDLSYSSVGVSGLVTSQGISRTMTKGFFEWRVSGNVGDNGSSCSLNSFKAVCMNLKDNGNSCSLTNGERRSP